MTTLTHREKLNTWFEEPAHEILYSHEAHNEAGGEPSIFVVKIRDQISFVRIFSICGNPQISIDKEYRVPELAPTSETDYQRGHGIGYTEGYSQGQHDTLHECGYDEESPSLELHGGPDWERGRCGSNEEEES